MLLGLVKLHRHLLMCEVLKIVLVGMEPLILVCEDSLRLDQLTHKHLHKSFGIICGIQQSLYQQHSNERHVLEDRS